MPNTPIESLDISFHLNTTLCDAEFAFNLTIRRNETMINCKKKLKVEINNWALAGPQHSRPRYEERD
jgi:hypothetical protein